MAISYGRVIAPFPGGAPRSKDERVEKMLRELLILCELADQGLDRQSAGIDDPWSGPPRSQRLETSLPRERDSE